jgi:hypothetical protein
VAEHSTESDHQIKFHEARILAKTSGYMDELVRETVDIKSHQDGMNREEGFDPSASILGHSKTHTSQKSQEDAGKSMQKRKQNGLTTGMSG